MMCNQKNKLGKRYRHQRGHEVQAGAQAAVEVELFNKKHAFCDFLAHHHQDTRPTEGVHLSPMSFAWQTPGTVRLEDARERQSLNGGGERSARDGGWYPGKFLGMMVAKAQEAAPHVARAAAETLDSAAEAASRASDASLGRIGGTLPGQIERSVHVLTGLADPSEPDGQIPLAILANARGLVFLTQVKAGFLWSGAVGVGIIVARLRDGRWSAPASVGQLGVGFGLQAGVQKSDTVIVLNTDAAVEAFTSRGQVKFGTDAAIAAGPIGMPRAARPFSTVRLPSDASDPMSPRSPSGTYSTHALTPPADRRPPPVPPSRRPSRGDGGTAGRPRPRGMLLVLARARLLRRALARGRARHVQSPRPPPCRVWPRAAHSSCPGLAQYAPQRPIGLLRTSCAPHGDAHVHSSHAPTLWAICHFVGRLPPTSTRGWPII